MNLKTSVKSLNSCWSTGILYSWLSIQAFRNWSWRTVLQESRATSSSCFWCRSWVANRNYSRHWGNNIWTLKPTQNLEMPVVGLGVGGHVLAGIWHPIPHTKMAEVFSRFSEMIHNPDITVIIGGRIENDTQPPIKNWFQSVFQWTHFWDFFIQICI